MRWENSIVIQAPVHDVWSLTIDITNWPAVTPTVRRVERLEPGPLRIGSTARLKQPGQPEAVWTVTRLEPDRDFTWQTTLMGITMIGSHRLEPVSGGCRNTLAVDIAGRGARLYGLLFGGLVRRAIQKENAGFKANAEAHPSTVE